MRQTLGILVTILLLATGAMAHDLGTQAPVKPAGDHQPAPPPNPEMIRQGGDTLDDAIPLSVPGSATGTTAGYSNDYDEVCPFDSDSPDVVYTLAPQHDIPVDIDMLGSTYDTKIYVYAEDMTLVACNDDFYPDYVSRLENVSLLGGAEYFLVIDGYGGAAGDYVVEITEFEPCVIEAPAVVQLEGEPPLVDGYLDLHNGGCNTEGPTPFGNITSPVFCGVSGWYLSAEGTQSRDTDWFQLEVPSWGYVDIMGDAEFATYMFELAPQDCGTVGVIQSVTMGPCQEGIIAIPGEPGSTVWFWVGPTTFEGPVNEYDYILYMSIAVATETHSWSAIKGLFDD